VIPNAQGYTYNGKIVSFRVNGYPAAQTVVWTTGGNVVISLTATSTQ